MTSTAFLLLAMTLAVALADWVAVSAGRRTVEYIAKPLTMVMLIAVALTLDADSQAALGAFVVALVFSLIGDVFLMLRGEDWFVFGLASFLAAHVAYIVGLVIMGVSLAVFGVGLVIVAVAVILIGGPVIREIRRGDEPGLAGPVMAYMGVISVMVACAIGTENPLAIGGAVLFYSSDALIAWTKFVKDYPWGRVAVMITYHLGQIGLVLSLISG